MPEIKKEVKPEDNQKAPAPNTVRKDQPASPKVFDSAKVCSAVEQAAEKAKNKEDVTSVSMESEIPKGKHREEKIYTDKGTDLNVVEFLGLGCIILDFGTFVPNAQIVYDKDGIAYLKHF